MIWSTQDYQKIIRYLYGLILNPLKRIRAVPPFEWSQIVVLQLIAAAISGGLAGVTAQFFINVFLGIFIFPIVVVITTMIAVVFFYYFYLLLIGRRLDYRKLYVLLVFASLPMLVFHIISPLLPFIDIAGYLVTAILTLVGLTENFGVPKAITLRLVLVIFGLLILQWGIDFYFSRAH